MSYKLTPYQAITSTCIDFEPLLNGVYFSFIVSIILLTVSSFIGNWICEDYEKLIYFVHVMFWPLFADLISENCLVIKNIFFINLVLM